jgi:sec-independent protein translocase protein TatC
MSEEREDAPNEEGLQMSFLDHLDELRLRIVRSVIGIAVAFVFCFLFAKQIYNFLEVPVKQQLKKARVLEQAKFGEADPAQFKEGETLDYTFVRDAAIGGVRIPQGTTVPARATLVDGKLALVLQRRWVVGPSVVPEGKPITAILQESERANVFAEDDKLVLRGVTSAFTLYVQVALYTGIGLAIPFLLYQIWAFIAPGLYQHEKKYVVPVLTMAAVFFVLGASFAYKIAFPVACDYLLNWQTEGGFRTLLDAEDYFNLIMLIMLGLGVVFQIPTVSFLLGRIGLITPRIMLKVWRHAIIAIAIIAAVLTPTPDALNMLVFMGPMLALYFISIGIVWLFGKPRRTDAEVTALAPGD